MLYGINPLQARIWKWCFLSFYVTRVWEQATKTRASLFCFPGRFIVDFSQFFDIFPVIMSEYGQTKEKPTPILTSDFVQERKAARRKLIEEVEQRRSENYKRFILKHRLQTNSDIDTLTII